MRRLVRVVAVALLAAFAGSIGFLAAAAVIGVSNAIAPFRFPEDEGSVREFLVAALAYLSWAVTSTTIFVVCLRALLARWGTGSKWP